MLVPDPLSAAALRVLETLKGRGLMLATVESCTGGLITAALTSHSGSSAVLDRGFITYSYEAKTDLVGVPAALIAADGAVSEAVARAMAEGALDRSRADIAVAVTGIAGPTGATPGKPVGLVHLAAARRGGPTRHRREVFAGDRDAVRQQAVLVALAMVEESAG